MTRPDRGESKGDDRRPAKPPKRDWRPGASNAPSRKPAESGTGAQSRGDAADRPRKAADARTSGEGKRTSGASGADARGSRADGGAKRSFGSGNPGRPIVDGQRQGSSSRGSDRAAAQGKQGSAGGSAAAPTRSGSGQSAGRGVSDRPRAASGQGGQVRVHKTAAGVSDAANGSADRAVAQGDSSPAAASREGGNSAPVGAKRSGGDKKSGAPKRSGGAKQSGDAKRSGGTKPPSGGKKPLSKAVRGAMASPDTHGLDPVRLVARDVLRAVRERDAYANLVLPGLLRERKISGRDAALATELTYGAARALGLLDAVIAAGAGRPVSEIDGPLLDTLRLGTYQLLRTRIGAHAAVDTSVAMVRAELDSSRGGFANAVLRRVSEKTAEEWVAQLAPADPLGHMAFEFAHPVWIAQAFADALGARAGELRDVLEADDARPLVHLVARPGEMTAEELALVTGGDEGRWSPYAVYLEGGDPGKLEPVREGLAGVQDEGSQLVALAVTRAPLEGPDGGRWLDLCAGPGGKAALLGAIADIDGFRLDAVEPSEHRAELVKQSTRNMPVDVHIADGRESGLTPGYDRILVDAPCTGLGALRRRPEARWRRKPSDVGDLVSLQRELLSAAWDLVRPGGVVVYSTCSPHLAETVGVVADMVRRTDAEQLDTRELIPGVPDLGDGPGAQLWPHRHGTDAMFVAALRKPLQSQ